MNALKASNAFGWEVKCWILHQRAVELWTGCGTSHVKGCTGPNRPNGLSWCLLKWNLKDRKWTWSDLDFGDWPPQTNDFSAETFGQTMPKTRLWKTGTYWYWDIARLDQSWSYGHEVPQSPSPLNQWTYMDLRMFCCKVLWISNSTNPRTLQTSLTSLTSHSQVFSKIDPFILLLFSFFLLCFFFFFSLFPESVWAQGSSNSGGL